MDGRTGRGGPAANAAVCLRTTFHQVPKSNLHSPALAVSVSVSVSATQTIKNNQHFNNNLVYLVKFQ